MQRPHRRARTPRVRPVRSLLKVGDQGRVFSEWRVHFQQDCGSLKSDGFRLSHRPHTRCSEIDAVEGFGLLVRWPAKPPQGLVLVGTVPPGPDSVNIITVRRNKCLQFLRPAQHRSTGFLSLFLWINSLTFRPTHTLNCGNGDPINRTNKRSGPVWHPLFVNISKTQTVHVAHKLPVVGMAAWCLKPHVGDYILVPRQS